MKKVLIASGVAVLAFAMVAGAATSTFTSNLTVGSTGPEVVALQTALISAGFNIPAITSGVAQKGYFGSQTKAAVAAYQVAKGIVNPGTGFFGPLTRNVLNAGGTVVVAPVGCPVGYTCTANPGTTPVVSMTGSDGSVSVSDSAFVSSGQNIKKGETKNVVAVKLQATAGPVTVTRVDAHFSVRPWLFFSQATLTDSSGRVLATKLLGSINDVTEITVGSDYLVRFDGLNYVVAPGTNPDLAVGVSVLAATDKITTNGMTVYAGIPISAIRTINGLGFSDSLGGIAFSTNASGVGARSFTLSSTGSVADISTGISTASPSTQVSQVVSATVPTNNVTLGMFSLKSANNTSTLQSIAFNVTTSPVFLQSEVLSNLRIMIGSTSYGAITFTDLGVATFTNLSIPLAQDVWTDVKLVADIAATTTDVTVYSVLDASTVNAIDSTYTQATVGGLAYASATNDQTSVNTLLTINSVSLSVSSTPCTVTQLLAEKANSSVTTAAAFSCTFTLANNSSNDLFVPGNVATFLYATTTTPTGNASSTITAIAPMLSIAGDSTASPIAYYKLPNRGSRSFTVTGLLQSRGGVTQDERINITDVQYGTTNTGLGSHITSGLTTLTVDAVLAPKN